MAKVGILGATGMVGNELLKVLIDRKFPIEYLGLYASEKSADKKRIRFQDRRIIIEELREKEKNKSNSLNAILEQGIIVENADNADYSELDIAFFAIGGGWPKENAKKAENKGCYVIDNSSTFRYDKDIPLVIPEINPDAIKDSKLIANPNCTTAIAAIPLWQIYKNFGLEKVIVSTYQATSGAGRKGMEELEKETRNVINGGRADNEKFQHPIPFNVIPHIDEFQDNRYTREEMKVVWELRKIFGDDKIPISCTCVRIPTYRAHAESIVVETKKPIDPNEIREIFENTEGITVKDDIKENIYPMPLTASEKYNVEVGRIRQNLIFGENGLEFFICGDQLLKGAALNAVQIGELVVEKYFK